MWIDAWTWDDGNLGELARHGLGPDEVHDVADGSPRFRRNRRGRAATHQMVGPDLGGRFWTICIREGGDGVWRAITGWPSEPHERDWYHRS